VLDVPLLFETGGEDRVDAVVVVTTTPEIQRQRLQRRAGMSAEQLAALTARQMPDAARGRISSSTPAANSPRPGSRWAMS
jgi:dephospho-CoA kinase